MKSFINSSDLKTFLGITSIESDALLSQLADRACEQLNTLCNRTFQKSETVEKFLGTGSDVFFPCNLPFSFSDDGSITIEGQTDPIGPSGVRVLEDEGFITLREKTFTEGKLCTVTYSSGFDEVPGDVKQAAIEMAVFMFNRNKSTGIDSETDGPVSVTYSKMEVSEIPSVKLVVEAYRIPNMA